LTKQIFSGVPNADQWQLATAKALFTRAQSVSCLDVLHAKCLKMIWTLENDKLILVMMFCGIFKSGHQNV
jgi:hypothetical protein